MPDFPTFNHDLLYSPRNRAERLIALGRVVLAAFSLLAIWLDPSTPARYANTTYTLLIIYLGYALLLIPLAWRPDLPLKHLGLLTHGVDLLVFTLIIYLTEGPTSPFFVYFVFALLAATLRWQWRGTLWTALAILPIFIGMGMYAAYILHDPAFELNRYIIRSVYLVVVAITLGYLSVYEQILRNELSRLAAWPRDIPAQSLVKEVLSAAAKILTAPRVLMIWEELEEPWRYVAVYGKGELHTSREAPAAFEPLVARPLTDAHFLCLDVRAIMPKVLYSASANFHRWQGSPLHPDLQSHFAIGSVLSLNLPGENFQGRLFALDKGDLTSDDLILGEIVAQRIAADIDRFYQHQRLQQAATTEERIRLARDLHDGVLQSLTGVALQLQTLHRLLEDNPQAARERLQNIQTLIAAEQRELRAFVQQMKPAPLSPIVEGPSLTARIDELARKTERQWDLRVELSMDLQEQIPRTLAHAIYRIVQEALVNAARHSRASTVRVKLGMENGHVQITAADDGHGFPFHGRYDLAALTTARRGPESLKGRIASLGGELIIDSSESGSDLEITLPLRDVSKPHLLDI